MSIKGQRAITKWMLVFSPLPKGHPAYQEHEDVQNIVIAAIFGGALIGLVIGVLLTFIFRGG